MCSKKWEKTNREMMRWPRNGEGGRDWPLNLKSATSKLEAGKVVSFTVIGLNREKERERWGWESRREEGDDANKDGAWRRMEAQRMNDGSVWTLLPTSVDVAGGSGLEEKTWMFVYRFFFGWVLKWSCRVGGGWSGSRGRVSDGLRLCAVFMQ